jgi:hypothetical protein
MILGDLQPGDVFRKPRGRQHYTVVSIQSVLATENSSRPLSVNPSGQILVGKYHGTSAKTAEVRRDFIRTSQMWVGAIFFVSKAGWLYKEDMSLEVILIQRGQHATLWERLTNAEA